MNINKIINRNAIAQNPNLTAMRVQNSGVMKAVEYKTHLNNLEILDEVWKINHWIMASKKMKRELGLIGVGRYIKKEN